MTWLSRPWAVLAGMAMGIYIGIYHKGAAAHLAPLGDFYLALLEMCVLPILVTAVVSGLGRLFGGHAPCINMRRLLLFFILGLLVASATGILAGHLLQPGRGLSQADRSALGSRLNAAEDPETGLHAKKNTALPQLILDMVPRNVVAAISQGPSLAVLFFSILFGLALGVVRTPASESVLVTMEGIYEAFLKIILWILRGLPIGVLGLFAGHIAHTGPHVLSALFGLVLACVLGTLILMVFFMAAIWRMVGGPLWISLVLFRQTLIIALTSSAFATIPTALKTFETSLKLPREAVSLIYPLGVNLNRYGSVFQFALAALFMMQLYDLPLDGESLLLIWFGAILAGMAAMSGLPGLAMLAVVLDLLDLPSQVAIILLTSIDTILVPMLVLISVYGNCALTILVCRGQPPVDPEDTSTEEHWLERDDTTSITYY